YAGEVKIFKALEYFSLVKRFGDVPWLSRDLGADSEELYAPRDSRILVMDSVLQDLDWAIAKLPGKQEAEAGRINRDVALAVKARICLHEGTFRKYHGMEGSEKFLNEALDASNLLMQEGNYQVFDQGNPQADYGTVFSSLDLSGNPEIILYKKYETDLLGTRTVQFIHDNAMNSGASKSLVDAYLCDDGLPVSMSPRFLGHSSIDEEMLNRDPRLTQTIVYPRTKMQAGLPGPAIPGTDFGGSSLSAGICPTGYQILKYWVDDIEEYLRIQNGILDAPLFRYAETLLIHAEAAAELGVCDQAVLDKTINILRDRAGMPHLLLPAAEAWENNPDYRLDYENISSALINEVRRERRVELAVENFRYDDLIRWKEGKLLEQRLLGMKFVQSVYPGVEVGQDIFLDENGFIWPYARSLPNGRTFDENKHYYFPLPTEELVLNPNLEQNEGW
ncbi:MAG TPA: RagB/SusD family nutrient uptake outer membrane protein, partial [Anseongella sp.]|nr:RagB/SusD family nutrient uptake outer membrane protein [Anseongella sp.]